MMNQNIPLSLPTLYPDSSGNFDHGTQKGDLIWSNIQYTFQYQCGSGDMTTIN